MSFKIHHNYAISETAQCPRSEQLRRRDIEKIHVYLRIYYNDKEVTKTQALPLDSINFSANFSNSLNNALENASSNAALIALQVTEIPDSIRIDIYETGVFDDILVGEVFVPIPGPSDTIKMDCDYIDVEFSGKNFTARANLEDANSPTAEGWYSGKLKLICAWNTDDFGRSLGPKKM